MAANLDIHHCEICQEELDNLAFCPNWQQADHNIPLSPEEREQYERDETASLVRAETPREAYTDEARYL